MCRDRFLHFVIAAAVALAILFPAGACAYDFLLTPSIGVREEYNNNLFFSQDNEEENWLTTVSPGLALEWKTERLDALLSGTAYWMNYSNDDYDLDTTDYTVRGRLAWRLSPEFRLSARGEFRRESRPDRHFEEAGLVDASTDYRQIYNALAEWAVTDASDVTASYTYDRLDYINESTRDGDNHTAGVGFIHDLSWFTELTQGRANFNYNRGLYETLTIENYVFTVGMFRSVHELWSVMVNAGAMYTESAFEDPFGATEKTYNTGWSGDASLIYTGEKASANLNFSHGLSPAYGYSGASLRTSAVLSLERRFIHDFAATFSTGYYINKSDAGQFSTQDIDERSLYVRPGLRWKATRNIVIDAAYQYRQVDYRLTGGDASQQLVYAGVNLSYPFYDE